MILPFSTALMSVSRRTAADVSFESSTKDLMDNSQYHWCAPISALLQLRETLHWMGNFTESILEGTLGI